GLDAETVGVADVDGDGLPDLIAGGSGYLFVARGLGAHAFDDPIHVPSSGVWTVRGSDLAVARWTDPSVVDVYRWNGNKALAVAASLIFSRPVSMLVGADLNGDGVEDLLAGTSDGSSGSVAVALGRGRFSFEAPTESEVGPVRRLAVGDFDGDGIRDLG